MADTIICQSKTTKSHIYTMYSVTVLGNKRNGTWNKTNTPKNKNLVNPLTHHCQFRHTFGKLSSFNFLPSDTPEKLKLRRSSSVLEDVSSKTTISCKGVPASLNKGLILRHHFSKFGKVKQVRPVPAKRAATIQFESHVS